MSIIWQYLDKREATVRAFRDSSSMEYIIKNTDAEVAAARDRMTGTGGISYDGMPHAHTPQGRRGQACKRN